jgi:hypothetical protein
MVESRALADAVLGRLVRACGQNPTMRFTVTRSIDRSGAHRISYHGGRLNARPELLADLLRRKLVQVTEENPGYIVIGVTVRGFDYYHRHLNTEIDL